MKELMPGVYDDDQGGIHIDLAVLLRASGYPDNPSARETMETVLRQMFGDAVIVTDDPIPRGGKVPD
jgi:hypothetical protein